MKAVLRDAPLHFLTVRELGALLRAREISSVELTRHYLDRLQTTGAKLNAVACVPTATALAQARAADRELRAGRDRGPLHGIPYGAKDLLATRGIPTRWGSPAHAGQVFPYDATVVARLREAGAVLAAKLAMVELAGGGGYNSSGASATGPCLCPWDVGRWAGGSSSGSGAAVAAGAVGFAIGTETWGSITVPAAFCGVAGLRPTYGRVSRHGAMALSWTMDKVGVLARSAEDAGLVLAAIAGPDPEDPSCVAGPFGLARGWRSRVARYRVGIVPHRYERARHVERLFHTASDVLKQAGAHLADAKYPRAPGVAAAADLIITAEGAAAFENLIRSPRLEQLADAEQQAGLLAGMAISATDYIRAQRIRVDAVHALNGIWDHFDVLVAPTLLASAPDAHRPLSDDRQPWGGNGGPGNLAGWPSISVPMGFGPNGLPYGLEVIGPSGGEQRILDVAMCYQHLTNWHHHHPPV